MTCATSSVPDKSTITAPPCVVVLVPENTTSLCPAGSIASTLVTNAALFSPNVSITVKISIMVAYTGVAKLTCSHSVSVLSAAIQK